MEINQKPTISNNASVNKLVMQSVIKQTTQQYRLDTAESDVPSFKSYTDKYNIDNTDRFLHTISHVKLDGPDVVIYQNKVNDSFLMGVSAANITVTDEILRIPKAEVVQLLQELYTQESS